MRPIWAKKKTTCRACKNPILREEKRVDRLLKINNSKQFITERFHLGCVEDFLGRWFTRNSFESTIKLKTGRPSLDISPEQKRKRKQVISSVSGFKQEFSKKLYPIFTNKRNLEGLTQKELNYFQSYNQRLAKIKSKLEDLGGIPNNITEMHGHDLSHILSLNPHLDRIL